MAENQEKPKIGTQEHLQDVLNRYLKIWDGDLSLIDSTLAPTLSFYADRFPAANGGSQPIDIDSAEGFRTFVVRSRTGWEKYEFKIHAWTGNGNQLAVRWRLEAIMGPDFAIVPTTLKPGDPVTYNGTDFLILNKETGLIEEVSSAQDLITLFHNLGLTGITV